MCSEQRTGTWDASAQPRGEGPSSRQVLLTPLGPRAGLEGGPRALPHQLTRLAPQTYDIQGSLQKDSQVTVSIVLENQSSSFLKSMELNVLDSLNTKLARPEGSSVHDGVPVPFQLPPGEPATGVPGTSVFSSHSLPWSQGAHSARGGRAPPRPSPHRFSGPACRLALARHLQRSPVRVHHSEHRHGPEAQGDPVFHCQGAWGLQDPSANSSTPRTQGPVS